MLYATDDPGRREAAPVPRAARVRRAAAVPRRLQPAVAPAHRAQGLRGRLHLGRGARAPTSACPTSASRRSPRSPGAAQQIARMTELPAHHRRRHGLRRADERRAHDPDARGRRARRHAHRGPDQPEAVRSPRRQVGRRRGHRDQAHPRRRRCPARPELPDHGAHRHPRRRGAGCRDRPREGARGCRRRRDLPRGDALARRSSRPCARRSTCRSWPT